MKRMTIDASTKSTGVAIFEDDDLIFHTCIEDSSSDTFKRIFKMRDEIEKLYIQYEPETIVMEDVRPEDVTHNQNVFNALHYLQAEIVLNLYEKYKIKVELIHVNTWRKACGIQTGRGIKRDALKQKDIEFVKTHYDIDVNDDVADAICIGFATKCSNSFLI